MIAIIYLATSCGSSPTEDEMFVEDKGQGYGYKINHINTINGQKIYQSKFKGYGRRGKNYSMAGSFIASFHFCRNQGKQVVGVSSRDLSTSSTKTWDWGLFGHVDYRWTVAEYGTTFACLKNRFNLNIEKFEVSNVSPELLKGLVHDFKGGALIQNVKGKNSTPLKEGDVILSVGNDRIGSKDDLDATLIDYQGMPKTTLKIIRDKKLKIVNINLMNKTPIIAENSLGMLRSMCIKDRRFPTCRDQSLVKNLPPEKQPEFK